MKQWDFGTSILKEDKTEVGIKLRYNPSGLMRCYGFQFVLDEGAQKTQVHYEIDVVCLRELSGNSFLIEINKKDIFINKKLPDGKHEEFAAACGKVIYPLQLEVNNYGTVMGVYNHPTIYQRWTKVEQELKRYYDDDFFRKQLKQRTAIFKDVKRLRQLITSNDWFITLFFTNLNFSKSEEIHRFPVYMSSSVPYIITKHFKTHAKYQDKKIITLTGKCIDRRNEQQVLNNSAATDSTSPPLDGKLSLKYQCNTEMHINSITGDITLAFPSGKEKKVSIALYHLKNKVPISSEEKMKINNDEEKAAQADLKAKQEPTTYSIFGKKFQLGKKKNK